MTETKELAEIVRPQAPAAYFPTDSDWKMMLDFGTKALKSGMLPTSIKTVEGAAIIALKGRELGIPFMQAIAHVHVIGGKPAMSAELLQALARKNLPGLVINIIQSTDTIAEIEFIRPERGSKPFKLAFTIQDAERAKLLIKDVWKQYPAAMLWSRAVSAGLRRVCPEALMGVSYTPEEMGAPVDGEGHVIETTGRKVEEPKSAPAPSDLDPAYAYERKNLNNKLMTLVSELDLDSNQISKLISTEYKVKSSKELTNGQMQNLIEELEKEKAAIYAPAPIAKEPQQQAELPEWEKDLMGPLK